MKKVFLISLAALVSIIVTGLTNSGFFLFFTIVLIGFAYIQLILTKLNTK